MNRVEIQRALYTARNNYLKAKQEMEFYKREILFLKDMEKSLNAPSLYDELFGNSPEVYGS